MEPAPNAALSAETGKDNQAKGRGKQKIRRRNYDRAKKLGLDYNPRNGLVEKAKKKVKNDVTKTPSK